VFPSTHIVGASASSNPIYLVGVGMRRKYLIIAEFDVYLVGLGLSKDSMQKAVEWVKTPEESRKPLSSYVLPKKGLSSQPKTIKAGVMLQMVRGATKQQFVEAFREAFAGVNVEHFNNFQPLLESCMGDKGMQAKDEMGFFFMNDGSLILAKNGEVKGSITIPEINERLFDIYSDPKRAVSKELTTSISNNLLQVQQQFGSN
jgi:hypothetical protein